MRFRESVKFRGHGAINTNIASLALAAAGLPFASSASVTLSGQFSGIGSRAAGYGGMIKLVFPLN